MTPSLSVVMPYYRNPRMLARQLVVWAWEWPQEWRPRVQIVIVDDGSPADEAAADVVQTMSFYPQLPAIAVYQVKEDRPWHQHAARNLGAHVAQAPVLFMTDMDHVIPADTLSIALDFRSNDQAMTFSRRDAPANEPWKSDAWSTMAPTVRPDGSLKPHVNSFVITKAAYWRVGGYDEDYCGIYGTDGVFRRRLWSALEQVFCPLPLIRVAREVIPDASTRTLPRKEGRPSGTKHAIAAAKARSGRADKIVTLNFPWERVL
jgi:hypothetical protein